MIIDEKKAAYIKRGDVTCYILLAVAAAGLIFFAVCFPVSRAENSRTLLILSYVLSSSLVALGAAGAAACNLTMQKKADKLISDYILSVCLANPQAMHPERDSLTFYITLDGCKFLMNANGYKESLVFDFSAFKRLSFARKASISAEIGNRLTVTFCKLYDRGATYRDVSFVNKTGGRKDKSVPIITGGSPDRKSYKIYLKLK